MAITQRSTKNTNRIKVTNKIIEDNLVDDMTEVISEVNNLIDGSQKTDTISEKTSGAGVTVDGLLIKDRGISANSMRGAFYPSVAQNNITAGTGGAISVANYLTTINTDAGGDAFTLANGTQIGQMKKILLVTDGGGNGVITFATATASGNTATFDDAGDSLLLQWSGTAWIILENSGVTMTTV